MEPSFLSPLGLEVLPPGALPGSISSMPRTLLSDLHNLCNRPSPVRQSRLNTVCQTWAPRSRSEVVPDAFLTIERAKKQPGDSISLRFL